MITKALVKVLIPVQRKLRLLFIVVFLLGIAVGASLSALVQNSLFTWICSASFGQASFLGLAVVLTGPLLVSFLAFYFTVPILILPIAFMKAVIFGFCGCCILFAYGDAGWLVRLLLLFSDSTMLTALCWYWLKHLDGTRFGLKQNTLLCLLSALIIGITDYMYISPFAAILLQR